MERIIWVLVAAMGMALTGCIPSEPPTPQSLGEGEGESTAEGVPVEGAPSEGATAPGGPGTGVEEADPAALVAQWHEAAKEFKGIPSTAAGAVAVAEELAALSPDALLPLVGIMGDPASGPYVSVLAVQCIAPHITPSYVEPLGPLLDPGNDDTVRACAATLLGKIDDARVDGLLRKILADPERRVSFSAKVGLARRGDEAIRQELRDWYSARESSIDEMDHVVRLLLESTQAGDLPVLGEALLSEVMLPGVKMEIALEMGRLGDASVLDTLREAVEKMANEGFRTVAESAIAAIEERERGNAAGA